MSLTDSGEIDWIGDNLWQLIKAALSLNRRSCHSRTCRASISVSHRQWQDRLDRGDLRIGDNLWQLVKAALLIATGAHGLHMREGGVGFTRVAMRPGANMTGLVAFGIRSPSEPAVGLL